MKLRCDIFGIGLLGLVLICSSCTEKNASNPDGGGGETSASGGTEARVGIFELACGCDEAVTSTKLCGNYVKVDGDFMPLAGAKLDTEAFPDHDPDMIACHKGILKARLEGKVVDGTFVATKVELADAEAGK